MKGVSGRVSRRGNGQVRLALNALAVDVLVSARDGAVVSWSETEWATMTRSANRLVFVERC